MININDFLMNGTITEIPFGISRNDLINIMGHEGNVAFGFKKDKLPSIYKYEMTEFYFQSQNIDKLSGIMIQLGSCPSKTGLLGFDYKWLRNDLTLDDVKEQLELLNIAYKVSTNKYDCSQEIKTVSNIKFSFYIGDNHICEIGKFIEFKN